MNIRKRRYLEEKILRKLSIYTATCWAGPSVFRTLSKVVNVRLKIRLLSKLIKKNSKRRLLYFFICRSVLWLSQLIFFYLLILNLSTLRCKDIRSEFTQLLVILIYSLIFSYYLFCFFLVHTIILLRHF